MEKKPRIYCSFIIYFAVRDLVRIMFEFTVLTLTCLTLLVVSLIVLLFLVFLKSKKVDRLKQILQGTIKKVASTNVCLHHFGFLNSYPKGKPIPSECMGCSDIFECLSYREKKPKTTKKKPRKRKTRKVTKTRKKRR